MLLAASLLLALAPQDFGDLGRNPDPPPEDPVLGPQWLLVRGADESVTNLPWERIAFSYLMRYSRRIVTPDQGAAFPASSRLVVGTPQGNPLVAELAPRFGLRFEGNLARFRGALYGVDVGLVLVSDDPDGEGTLTLVTSGGPIGLQACFSVPLDLTRPGYAVLRSGRTVERGPLLLELERDEPRVVDLDALARDLLARQADVPAPEAALALARTLEGWHFAYDALAGPHLDLFAYATQVLCPPRPEVLAARARLEGRDLRAEIVEAHHALRALLGEAARSRPAPLVHLVCDLPERTNALTRGFDLASGRARVVLNLAALTEEGALHAAAIHESVHALQDLQGEVLQDEAATEGVAVCLTTLAAPQLPLHVALMWSEEQLAAAEERREALVAAFLRDMRSLQPRVNAAWMRLDSPMAPVEGAPTRCAYYVGYLAASAWLAADAQRRPADLLGVRPSELFGVLR